MAIEVVGAYCVRDIQGVAQRLLVVAPLYGLKHSLHLSNARGLVKVR